MESKPQLALSRLLKCLQKTYRLSDVKEQRKEFEANAATGKWGPPQKGETKRRNSNFSV